MRLAQLGTYKLRLAVASSLLVTALVVVYTVLMCSTNVKLLDPSSWHTRSRSAPLGRYPRPTWSDDQGCGATIKAFLHELALSESGKDRLHALASKRRAPDRMIVVPKMQKDDISWLSVYLPQIRHTVYAVDNTNAPFHPPVNKGNEAMTYLSFIIDHYDLLPKKIAFIHSHASSWHAPDIVDTLTRIQWEQIEYANLRCEVQPGCTVGMHPLAPDHDLAKAFAEAWPVLFEEVYGPLPAFVSTYCCAQFVVSRETLLHHPKSFYEQCQEWLITTPWPSDISGRVFEYVWHIMFGKPAEYCPPKDVCDCEVFGQGCPVDLKLESLGKD